MNIYDIDVKELNGSDTKLNAYKGKVVLIVNTAINCGLAPQYPELQKLYEKYEIEGFEIIDFPCNQFANQSPLSDDENNTYCTGRLGITFKQFAKIDVNGQNESELYTYLKKNSKNLFGSKIKWNFTKFLIGKDGKVIKRYSPTTKPSKIEKDILRELKKEV